MDQQRAGGVHQDNKHSAAMAPLFQMEALLPRSISPKISSILQSHVYPRVGRVFRALARFKSLLLGKSSSKSGVPWSAGSRAKHAAAIGYRATTKRSKIASGGSSLAPAKASHGSARWNVVTAPAPAGADEYCGYLRWLEEEDDTPDEVLVVEEEEDEDVDGSNEIDRLAEKFIARCHAKFLLEKQESYRRYQEMMARSV
jgi:hypothetical protein